MNKKNLFCFFSKITLFKNINIFNKEIYFLITVRNSYENSIKIINIYYGYGHFLREEKFNINLSDNSTIEDNIKKIINSRRFKLKLIFKRINNEITLSYINRFKNKHLVEIK